MKFYIGVTDFSWFNYLSQINPEDVNFWQPGGRKRFKVLEPGAPFLFKLKSPHNAIVGIGFFSNHIFLPLSVAWETFGNRNGVKTYGGFINLINNLRSKNNTLENNPNIGCIVLTNPIFFNREDWIPQPMDWKSNIVEGSGYNTTEPIGNFLWQEVEKRLERYKFFEQQDKKENQLILEEPESPEYGRTIQTKIRLGQGAFRTLITSAYSRRCAITGEKTLPALEAAHIKQYSESGPNFISNGILLRSDLHKLLDSGYMTITLGYKVEISKKIKEEYENGRDYYKLHGKDLLVLPFREQDKPAAKFIEWHNNIRYKG